LTPADRSAADVEGWILGLKAGYLRREADDIGNLCFIADKTNRQISDKAQGTTFRT